MPGILSFRFCVKAALLLVLLFSTGVAQSAELQTSVSFVGPCYFRLPGFRSFVLQYDYAGAPLDTLAAVRPDVQNPLATDSKMLVGSYTVTMLPGASLKLSARGFVPLAGRFVIAGEGDKPLVFVSRFYELYYRSGLLLLEVTPDDGTYIVLRNKGDVFVKGLNRSIFDLAAGQEVHFPLFGQARLKNRMSGFWNDPPTGFSAARRRPDSTSMSEKDAEDSEEAESDENDESANVPDDAATSTLAIDEKTAEDFTEDPAGAVEIVPDQMPASEKTETDEEI